MAHLLASRPACPAVVPRSAPRPRLGGVFFLVTVDLPRSRQSVTSGEPSALRLGNPLRVASRVGSCPTGCGGRGGGLRPSSLPLADRLSGFHQHQGCGCARHPHPFGTRCAPFRVRPPVSPLTLLPANTRATTDDERGHETAKTRRPLVTAARWPGREAVANIRLWQAGFSSASARPAA